MAHMLLFSLPWNLIKENILKKLSRFKQGAGEKALPTAPLSVSIPARGKLNGNYSETK